MRGGAGVVIVVAGVVVDGVIASVIVFVSQDEED